MKIAIDFDGVLHLDTIGSGSGNFIPDPPVSGAIEKLYELLINNEVEHIIIFSLRCHSEHGIQAMKKWILDELRKKYQINESFQKYLFKIGFSAIKPHVDIYIDDKALQFNGNWNDPKFSLTELLNFKPWNR